MSERIIEKIVPICEPIIKHIRELTRVYIDLFLPSVNQKNRDEIRAIRFSFIADLEPHLKECHDNIQCAIGSDFSREHLPILIRFIQDEVQSETDQYTKEWNDRGTTEQKTAIPTIIGIFDNLRVEISRCFNALVEVDEK